MPLYQSLIDQPGVPAEFGDEDHAGADGLAMTPAILLVLLDGMTEGVTVVERLAPDLGAYRGGLAEIGRDDVGLDLDSPTHQFGDHFATRIHCRGRIGLDQREDLGVGDEAALHHLGQPGAQLRLRQSDQGLEVAQDSGRLVEGADQVLSLGRVDARLAADCGVHHRQ